MINKTTVLIAEDDDILRELMVYFLERAGFQVLEAADGTEAYSQFLEFKPDVLVSDILMPNGNGIELAKKVIASKRPIPIFLISGYAADKDICDLETSPYWMGVFEKPFNEADLLAKIKLVCHEITTGQFPKNVPAPQLDLM